MATDATHGQARSVFVGRAALQRCPRLAFGTRRWEPDPLDLGLIASEGAGGGGFTSADPAQGIVAGASAASSVEPDQGPIARPRAVT